MRNKNNKFLLLISFFAIIGFVVYFYTLQTPQIDHNENQKWVDHYSTKVQPIFNDKCIACHSCFNSPCQLNLTSYEGVMRGASTINIYDFPKLEAREPTRLYRDANTTQEWREKGFFTVTGKKPKNILSYVIQTPKGIESGVQKEFNSEYSRRCIDSTAASNIKEYNTLNPAGRMPLGFPGLKKPEIDHIQTWLDHGTVGPETLDLERKALQGKISRSDILEWEDFFNRQNLKQKLVSRYLYEHLFIADLYFEQDPQLFFNIVRSKTKVGDIKEISTALPFDDPKMNFYYRLRPITNTIVHKSHVPFLLSERKKRRWEKDFLQQRWEKDIQSLPEYGKKASNPFITFSAIPVKARYQFLLENAGYHIMTFIKGPVCRGQTALNVINDHFWVFFMNPDQDVMVNLPEAYDKIANEIEFPSFAGSDILPLVNFRKRYWSSVETKFRYLEKEKPLSQESLWRGDLNESNATITVYRHFDSATVLRGLRGQTPKTVWVLDYQVFESIYYNLVAGYNVFGPVLHQLNSRLYMEISRVASEDLFLSFLPVNSRKKIRSSWNIPRPKKEQSTKKTIISWIADDIRDNFFKNYNYLGERVATQFSYNQLDVKKTFLDVLKSEYYNEKQFKSISDKHKYLSELSEVSTSALQYVPDTILLEVQDGKGEGQLWTLIHNKAHYNVGMLLFEQERRRPENDRLDLIRGVATSYLNLIVLLKQSDIQNFVSDFKKSNTKEQVSSLIKKYGLSRKDPKFWEVYKRLSQNNHTELTNELGYFDLNRYINL